MRKLVTPPTGWELLPVVAYPLSLLVGVVAISMLACAGVGVLMASTVGAMNMAVSAGLTAAVGIGLRMAGRKHTKHIMGRSEALLMVTLSWFTVGFVGAIPFLVGASFSVPDALFESFSGFTTTGATIMVEIESALDPALHFWRVLMHWLGGVGIVVLFVAVFPALGVGGRHLFYTEAAGPKSKGLSPRIRERSSILWRVYLIITLLEVGLLKLTGLSLFDSAVHSLSTMGTGGFSTLNSSVGGYGNHAAEWVILLFMVIAGTNFMLYPSALKHGPKVFLRHTETRVYLAIFLVVSVICAISILPERANIAEASRDGAFQVAAIMTTTGFGTDDYEVWPTLPKMLLMALFFIGGSSGSTAGGMKVHRIIVLVKAAVAEARRSFRPQLVRPLRVGGAVVSKEAVREVFAFCALFAFTVVAGAIAVAAIDPVDGTTAVMASLACVANVGPGLGMVGPTDNFAFFSGSTKLILSGLMVLGRLEILAVVALVMPSFWRK